MGLSQKSKAMQKNENNIKRKKHIGLAPLPCKEGKTEVKNEQYRSPACTTTLRWSGKSACILGLIPWLTTRQTLKITSQELKL